MSSPAQLRSAAEHLASGLPPLLAEAAQLATTVQLGMHGRRQAGQGGEFWQHRPALPGDSARMIDWRRSARTDEPFVQEKEWQAAQSVGIWADDALSMRFSSRPDLPQKQHRARLLGLASAILLLRGGERVCWARPGERPRAGEGQIMHMAAQAALPPRGEAGAADDSADAAPDGSAAAEYGQPDLSGLPARARALLVSDFLGDPDALRAQLRAAAGRGIRGALVQVLDPQEEQFPFAGRSLFESVGRSLQHETMRADALRQRYLERLRARRRLLAELARESGWQHLFHLTSAPASAALIWIWGALAPQRRGAQWPG